MSILNIESNESQIFVQEFIEYCKSININFDLIKIDDIIEIYNDSSRKYHDIEHIDSINSNIYQDYTSGTINKEQAYKLILIAYYHDIVYNAQENNNEEESAKKFLSHSAGVELHDDVLDIYNAIIATKYHKKIGATSEIFNKYDMSILLSDYDKLLNYENGIRHEYKMYAKDDYIKARVDFIEQCIIDYPQNKRNLIMLIDYIKIYTN